MSKAMNATLKAALAEKQTKHAPKTKIVQTRMDNAMYDAGAKILRKKGLRYGDFFRSATKQLIRDNAH